jgi:hypothetical protein
MTPAWTVYAWPPVLWQAGCRPQLQFVHQGTRVLRSPDGESFTAGQTLWAGPSQCGEAGVAWDWIQIAPGLVAIADPLALVTNVRLLGADGAVLTAHQAAPFLNEIVRSLPWQDEVQRALQHLPH